MEKWSRFDHNGDIKFGKLSSDNKTVTVCNGDMFGAYTETNEVLAVNDIKMLSPCKPSKKTSPS